MKLKKGDNVIVMAGKDKGKKGKIIRALPKKGKVIVEGLNMIKRHQRSRTTDGKGQTVSFSMPINVSNVMILDPRSGKHTRLGKKKVGDKMVRVARSSGQEI